MLIVLITLNQRLSAQGRSMMKMNSHLQIPCRDRSRKFRKRGRMQNASLESLIE